MYCEAIASSRIQAPRELGVKIYHRTPRSTHAIPPILCNDQTKGERWERRDENKLHLLSCTLRQQHCRAALHRPHCTPRTPPRHRNPETEDDYSLALHLHSSPHRRCSSLSALLRRSRAPTSGHRIVRTAGNECTEY